VDTVGKNEIAIRKYIDNQLKEDRLNEQLTLDKIDPFTGSKK
ncbi:MAG: IS200/IS605 family transposase, partial [Erysipelotrichaceae bacterium]|nr:IS200/IS605 family transposase [Erysipelotrichaceae bacterium]